MKQITLVLWLCLVTAFVLSSCKKDKNTPVNPGPTEETPLKVAVDKKVPADSMYSQCCVPGNFGFKFHSVTTGFIMKLGCRMPTAGTYTVTLWNFSSQSQLAQAQVTVSNTSDFTYASITPVTVAPNIHYVISVNSNSAGSFYQLYKKPTTAVSIYPFTSGNFTFDAPLYKSGASTAFPDYNNASDFPFMRGVADFVFVGLM